MSCVKPVAAIVGPLKRLCGLLLSLGPPAGLQLQDQVAQAVHQDVALPHPLGHIGDLRVLHFNSSRIKLITRPSPRCASPTARHIWR